MIKELKEVLSMSINDMQSELKTVRSFSIGRCLLVLICITGIVLTIKYPDHALNFLLVLGMSFLFAWLFVLALTILLCIFAYIFPKK